MPDYLSCETLDMWESLPLRIILRFKDKTLNVLDCSHTTLPRS